MGPCRENPLVPLLHPLLLIFDLHSPAPHLTTPLESPPTILEPNRPDSNSIHSSALEDLPGRKRGNLSIRRAEKRERITMQFSERVPEDLLAPIFEQLQDQRTLYACSLVSRTFNRAVTPILYRSWDTRVVVDLPANDRFVRSHKVFRRPPGLWFRTISQTF